MSAAKRSGARVFEETEDHAAAGGTVAPPGGATPPIRVLHQEADGATFAEDVRSGLGRPGQKELHSKYLYDAVGSELFEAITKLETYGLTQADERILRDQAASIAVQARPPLAVVELGSGSGRKVRPLLESFARTGPTTYAPIDISLDAIARCRAEIGRIRNIRFEGIVGEYLEGLSKATALRPDRGRVLVLFVGSSIGNFERSPAITFLRAVREILEPGDSILLGTDLVKPVEVLIAAYDDPAGVTAAFNRNLLVRVNRELDGDFDLGAWTHEVRWNESERRIEMHLRASTSQRVRIGAAGITVAFAAGETIWTESSHKFLPEEPGEMGRAAGFEEAAQWCDRAWAFAETLLVAR